MIYSMTGYGKSVLQLSSKKITVEVKSLNSKSLDINVRIPLYYREKELGIRKTIASHLVRGKIDFFIYVEDNGVEGTSKINNNVVKGYMSQLSEVTQSEEIELLKMAITLPDVLKTERKELDEEEWKDIKKSILQTLAKLQTYRLEEGKSLYTDFLLRINNLKTLLKETIKIDPERMKRVRERLQRAIEDLQVEVDQNRFEQELIYYLEKLDITEEKVRLNNHLTYFEQELNSNTSNGKKMGFITQEIGREINTIGSKSNYAPMQKIVVQMKDELEKIKEQLLNVL